MKDVRTWREKKGKEYVHKVVLRVKKNPAGHEGLERRKSNQEMMGKYADGKTI